MSVNAALTFRLLPAHQLVRHPCLLVLLHVKLVVVAQNAQRLTLVVLQEVRTTSRDFYHRIQVV